MIDMVGHFHGIDCQFDIHVALDLPPTGGIRVFLGRLGHEGITVILQPVHEGANGGIFLVLHQGGVVIGADQLAARGKFGE